MVSRQKESRQIRRFKERVGKKEGKAEETAMKELYKQVSYLLRKSFKPEELAQLAAKMGVIQRQRKLTAFTLMSTLMIGCLRETHDAGIESLRGMCLLLRKDFFDYIGIKPQALHQKINRKETAEFVKQVMSGIIKFRINKGLKKTSKKYPIDSSWKRILIQDSTVIALPIALKRIFRGCGGSASEAAVKCDFIIDQSTRSVLRVKLVGGRIPDVTMSADIVDHLEKGDLVIRDLGYFHLPQLSRIKKKNAQFISRLHKSAHVYLNKKDAKPMDLIAHLKKLDARQPSIDIQVYIGKTEKLPARLIGIKVPSEVVEMRRKKYKGDRKKEPSEELQEWNGYTLMITNISKKSLPIKTAIKIYKIRWQIELFFKNIKSNLGVDNFTGTNKYRILCMIYIKIAITVTVASIHAYAQQLVATGFEVSLDKLTKWLKDEERLKRVILSGDPTTLKVELERDLDLLCKQRPKKKCDASGLGKSESVENVYDNAA